MLLAKYKHKFLGPTQSRARNALSSCMWVCDVCSCISWAAVLCAIEGMSLVPLRDLAGVYKFILLNTHRDSHTDARIAYTQCCVAFRRHYDNLIQYN